MPKSSHSADCTALVGMQVQTQLPDARPFSTMRWSVFLPMVRRKILTIVHQILASGACFKYGTARPACFRAGMTRPPSSLRSTRLIPSSSVVPLGPQYAYRKGPVLETDLQLVGTASSTAPVPGVEASDLLESDNGSHMANPHSMQCLPLRLQSLELRQTRQPVQHSIMRA